jgi:hypothetical protein
MNKDKGYWLIAVLSLLLSSMAQASIEGTWPSKGVLNVTFEKPNHQPVRTVSNLDEFWVFNADKTFTQGGLTGAWKKKPGSHRLFEASYDLSGYVTHLTDFWADRGVTVSNVRILRNKLEIRKVSNGLSGEGILKYKMDVIENGGMQTTTVVIRSSFVAPSSATENAALSEFFPTMLPGQSSNAASSINTNATIQIPFTLQGP